MIEMYCRDHHDRVRDTAGRSGLERSDVPPLCPSCTALLEYSLRRIDQCRFGGDKPTCARCTVHCYRPARRSEIRAVMRYAGPRMTLKHPYLAVRHLLDRRRGPAPGDDPSDDTSPPS